MPNLALITGASSGIGLELARCHAARGGDLIVTARRGDALEALKVELQAKHGVKVHTIALDLGAAGGADKLIAAVEALVQPVDILINNAGFGGTGAFIDRDLADDLAMLDLNVRALMVLSHHFGKRMAARRTGRILNVSSTASYLPGPLQATYYATKAFVSSLSQAMSEEMRPHGVTVTALEPGPVNTGFMQAADMTKTRLGRTKVTAESVARYGYEAMLAGKLRAINEPALRLALNWLAPLVPRRLMLRVVRMMQTNRT